MRRQYFILASLFLILSVGCADEVAPQGIGNDEFSVTLALGQTLTKTSLGDKTGDVYPVLWEDGDRVSLNGLLSTAVSSPYSGTGTSVFKFMGEVSAPYSVIYPGEDRVTGYVTFMQNQTYKKGSVASGSLPMAGVSETLEDISLEHLGAVLRISLTGASSVRGILLRAMADEPLSGKWDIDAKSITESDSGGFVWLDVPSPVELSSDAEYFHVSIPSGEYSQGIRIVVFDKEGYSCRMIFGAGGFTAEAGMLYEMSEALFVPCNEPASLVTQAAELALDRDYIILLDDVDMSDIEWTPKDFSGVIEGLGHGIVNMAHPFILNLTGTVRDLAVTGDMAVDDMFEAGMIACSSNGGLIEGCISSGTLTVSTPDINTISYFGGICGRNRGTVQDCVNLADITGTSSIAAASKSQHFGGVTGAGAGQILTGSTNKGNISYEGTTSQSVYAGGVTGRGTNGALISGNANYGKVSSVLSKNRGNIVGACSADVVFSDNSDYSD